MRRMILATLVLLPVAAQAFAATPTEFKPSTSSATMVRSVEVGLTSEELAAHPAIKVVVHATVDASGTPRHLSIAKSAGTAVDEKVLAAVSQYRFKPATVDYAPVDAPVTITVKISKP